MRHQKKLTAALACALALSLCAGHVLADGATDPTQQVEAPLIIAPAPTEGTQSPYAEDTTVLPVFSAAPAPMARKAFIVEGSGAPVAAADAPGTVSFENLGPRMLEHNLNIRALSQNIEAIEAVDYEEMEKGLKN